MAKMTRKVRRQTTQMDQRTSRIENGMRKRKERGRRDSLLKILLRKGKLPYTPTVMSWLSAELNKPSRLITQAEIDAYLKG